MASHRSSQDWSEILLAYKNRQVSQAEFCRDRNISVAALYYHRSEQVETQNQPALIELPRTNTQTSGLIGAASPDCQIECYHASIGPVKVNCPSSRLAQVIAQLAQNPK